MRPSRATIGTAALVLAAALSSAQAKPRTIAVLQLSTDGLSEAAEGKIALGLEAGLSQADFTVVPRQTFTEALAKSDYDRGCLFGPCLAAVQRATGVEQVLVAHFSSTGSSYRYVVSLVTTATGAYRSQISERCEVCTLEEVITSATLSSVALVTETGGVRLAAPAQVTTGARRRRLAWIFVGAALAVGVVGAYARSQGRDNLSWGSAGGAGALGMAVFTVLLFD